jgi:hypothetical protein
MLPVVYMLFRDLKRKGFDLSVHVFCLSRRKPRRERERERERGMVRKRLREKEELGWGGGEESGITVINYSKTSVR